MVLLSPQIYFALNSPNLAALYFFSFLFYFIFPLVLSNYLYFLFSFSSFFILFVVSIQVVGNERAFGSLNDVVAFHTRNPVTDDGDLLLFPCQGKGDRKDLQELM